MKNKKSFRKGQVVKSGPDAILVTGKGKDVGYSTFAGVVIMALKREDEDKPPWSVGYHSDTWSTSAFKKVDIKLSKIIANELYPKS